MKVSDVGACLQCAAAYHDISGTCVPDYSRLDGGNVVAGTINACLRYTDATNCSKCDPNYALGARLINNVVNTVCYPINLEKCTSAIISTFTYNSVSTNSIACTKCDGNEALLVVDASSPYFTYFQFRNIDASADTVFDTNDLDNCLNYDIGNLLSASTFACRSCELINQYYSSGATCVARTIANLDKCSAYVPDADRCASCVADYYLLSGVCTIMPDTNCQKYDAVNDECVACKDGYAISYKTNNGKNECSNDYGISPALKPLIYAGHISACTRMTDCSATMYEGLGAGLDALYSCHKCKSDTKIPFTSVTVGNAYTSIDGLQQYYLNTDGTFDKTAVDNSNKCLTPAAVTFNLQDANFKFPSNCALGMLNADLAPSALHSSDSVVVDRSQMSIFCAACKPGFKPARESASALNVYSCTAITNCASSSRVNGCTVCSSGYTLRYDATTGVDHTACVSTTDVNCYAGLDGASAGKCAICKSGYSLNPDAVCERIDSIYCAANNFSFTNGFSLKDMPAVMRNNTNGAGCHKCQNGYIGMYTEVEDLQCTNSSYISLPTRVVNTGFDVNCNIFSQSNGVNVCQSCQPGYVVTSLNLCIQATSSLNNCATATNATTCAICLAGNSMINGKCVQNDKSNCMTFDERPASGVMTCTRCNSGFYLKDNTCYKGTVVDCDFYVDESTCGSCLDGTALVRLSTGQTQCMPITTHPDCVKYNADASNGQLVCTQCRASNFLLKIVATPIDVCNPVRPLNYCTDYDIAAYIRDSTLNCSACSSGYYASSGKCAKRTVTIDGCAQYAPDSALCVKCNAGSYINEAGTTCVLDPKGVAGCKVYTSETVCKFCDYGKYLSNNTCIAVDAAAIVTNCGLYSSATACFSCLPGFFLDNNTCTSTTAGNCLTFASASACATCPSGFNLKTDTNVTHCVARDAITNCSVHSNTEPVTCLECTTDYFPDATGACAAVTTKISNCAVYKDAATCTACADGFLLLNNVCTAYLANDGCSRRFSSAQPVCVACAAGYMLSADLVCQRVAGASNDGCLVADPDDASVCVVCNSGFVMNKLGNCTPNSLAMMSSAEESASMLSALVLIVMAALLW